MPDLGQPLRIHLAKTTQGESDYVQITSADGFSVNIVLIAPEIQIDDQRKAITRGSRRKKR